MEACRCGLWRYGVKREALNQRRAVRNHFALQNPATSHSCSHLAPPPFPPSPPLPPARTHIYSYPPPRRSHSRSHLAHVLLGGENQLVVDDLRVE